MPTNRTATAAPSAPPPTPATPRVVAAGNFLTGVGTKFGRLTIRVRVDTSALEVTDSRGEMPPQREPAPAPELKRKSRSGKKLVSGKKKIDRADRTRGRIRAGVVITPAAWGRLRLQGSHVLRSIESARRIASKRQCRRAGHLLAVIRLERTELEVSGATARQQQIQRELLDPMEPRRDPSSEFVHCRSYVRQALHAHETNRMDIDRPDGKIAWDRRQIYEGKRHAHVRNHSWTPAAQFAVRDASTRAAHDWC